MPPPFPLEGLPILFQPDAAHSCCEACDSDAFPCKTCFPICGSSSAGGLQQVPRIENWTDGFFAMEATCYNRQPEWNARVWDGFFRYATQHPAYGLFCEWYLTLGNVYDGSSRDPIWLNQNKAIYNATLTYFTHPFYQVTGPPKWWFGFSCDGLNIKEIFTGSGPSGRDCRGVYNKVAGSSTRGTVTIGSGTRPP